MAVVSRLPVYILLAFVFFSFGTAQECLSVNDILPQLPGDLQALIKQHIDVFAFKGTFFVPTAEAWANRDLQSAIYGKERLGQILELSIIPGVRLADRPSAGLVNGTIQLESKFKDTNKLFCVTLERPDNKLDVELIVTGKPSGDDATRFSLAGTPGNTFKAGAGEITIVKVYSDIKLQKNLTTMIKSVKQLEAMQHMQDAGDMHMAKVNVSKDVSKAASWTPPNVVKVVQCRNVDIFFVDHLLLPCPLCGKKCSAVIVNKLVQVVLPITSVFAGALTIAGFVAICCGCNACSETKGFCGFFWRCVCGSLLIFIILFELLIVAAYIGYAWYFKDAHKKDVSKLETRWKIYFTWAIVGAVLMGLVVISHVWAFISQARKRGRNKHKQFYDAAPPPMYQPVGAQGPMRA